MIRLFVGIALPESVRNRLYGLAGGVPGARWIEADNIHLTVRFIGDVDEAAFEDIDSALVQVHAAGFDMEIAGVGHYSRGRRPVILWAGVEPHPALIDLHRRVDGALVKAGLPPETRRYSPHISLARIKNGDAARVRSFESHNNLLRLEPFPVTHFTLFSSHLGSKSAAYRAEADYPLN